MSKSLNGTTASHLNNWKPRYEPLSVPRQVLSNRATRHHKLASPHARRDWSFRTVQIDVEPLTNAIDGPDQTVAPAEPSVFSWTKVSDWPPSTGAAAARIA